MVDQSVEGAPSSNGGQGGPDTEVSIPPVGKRRLLRNRRQVLLQIVAATVILACGIVIGAGGAFLHFKDNIVPDRVPPPGAIAQDMQARYELTDEQSEKVKTVVKESGERMRTLFQGIREKMDAEFLQLSTAMKEVLTAEQFKRWESDFKARRGHGPGRFGPGRGGPGPGGRQGRGGEPGPGGRYGPDGRYGPGRPGQRGPERGRFGERERERPEPNSPPEMP